MRSLVFLLAGLFASAGLMHGEIKTPENGPIEITSTGQTTYENGLATARDNVAIHIGNTDRRQSFYNSIKGTLLKFCSGLCQAIHEIRIETDVD